jgi:hypothetical protein
MIDRLRTRARTARRLTVLTATALVALSAPASAATSVVDAGSVIDRVASTSPVTVPKPVAPEPPSVDEVVAAVPSATGKAAESVASSDVAGSTSQRVEETISGTTDAVGETGQQVRAGLEGAADRASTLDLSPAAAVDRPASDHLAGNVTPADSRARLGAENSDVPPPLDLPPSGGVGGASAAGGPSAAGASPVELSGASSTPLSSLPGYRDTATRAGAAVADSSHAEAGREGAHGGHGPSASAASGASGGTSAPPSVAMMLLLVAFATPILLRAFKEASASLQPAPFIALLERPG